MRGFEHGIPESAHCRGGCGRPAKSSQFFCGDECRFWAKVRKGPFCWEWTAGLHTEGYGQFSAEIDGKRRPVGAHVFSYHLTHGTPLLGLSVLHHCDNRPCVRPDHLFRGTHTDNMQDAARKGRLHVPRPSAQKLSPDIVRLIQERVLAGEVRAHVAADYGISKTLVTLIMSGRRRQFDAPLDLTGRAHAAR